jgi:hypothetical protein
LTIWGQSGRGSVAAALREILLQELLTLEIKSQRGVAQKIATASARTPSSWSCAT